MGYSDHIHLETGALVLQFRLARESSSEILDWQVEVLTLALDETITANFKIRGDGFVQPMFFKLQNASFGWIIHKNFKNLTSTGKSRISDESKSD